MFWFYFIDKQGNGVFVCFVVGWDDDVMCWLLGVYYCVDKKSIVDMQVVIYEIGVVYVFVDVYDGWGLDEGLLLSCYDQLLCIECMLIKIGGYVFVLVGFNECGFVVQNSWGMGWGVSGFVVLSYEDWVMNGIDCWVVVLGVFQDLFDIKGCQLCIGCMVKVDCLVGGFCVMVGCGLVDVGVMLCVEDNFCDDFWFINYVFVYKFYQLLCIDEVYIYMLVLGNDGQLMVIDFICVCDDCEGLVCEIVVECLLIWFKVGKDKIVKFVFYVYGGFNFEVDFIQCICVLVFYFLVNGIYLLFFIWKIGLGEMLVDMFEDFKYCIVDGDCSEGWLDCLCEVVVEVKDCVIEVVVCQFVCGIWGEMCENVEGGVVIDYVFDFVVCMLCELCDIFVWFGCMLELYLVGYLVGFILIGYLFGCLGGVNVVQVVSCEFYVVVCFSGFVVQYFGVVDQVGVFLLKVLCLYVLIDVNECVDGLFFVDCDIYGKLLFYFVSCVFDDICKQFLLGMECVFILFDLVWLFDQWVVVFNVDVVVWFKFWLGGVLLNKVMIFKVCFIKIGDQIVVSYGSFDNNIDVLIGMLE